jgi:hypothetical protein
MPQQQPDWQILKQTDFSGGVNWIDDPADLDEKELSDARNVRLTTHKIVVQRDGYTQYNSSAVGAVEMRSMFHFKGYDGNLIPLVQIAGSPGSLLKGSAAFPGTGNLSTTIFIETASAAPAFIDAMWGIMIYTNGVDVPQTWEGNYGKCYGFRFSQTLTSTPPVYRDFSTEVADEDPLTYADIGTAASAATDGVFIRTRVPTITGVKIVMGTSVNAAAATIDFQKWTGSAWSSVTPTDGTAVSGGTITFGQSGDITFSAATTTPQIIDQIYG